MKTTKNDKADLIISNIVLQPLRNEMIIIQNAIKNLTEKYAFLMNDDLNETKTLLIKTFLESEISEEVDEDTQIELENKVFFEAISDETKSKIVNEAFEKFLLKMSVEELMKEKEGE